MRQAEELLQPKVEFNADYKNLVCFLNVDRELLTINISRHLHYLRELHTLLRRILQIVDTEDF